MKSFIDPPPIRLVIPPCLSIDKEIPLGPPALQVLPTMVPYYSPEEEFKLGLEEFKRRLLSQ